MAGSGGWWRDTRGCRDHFDGATGVNDICPACSKILRPGLRPWHLMCCSCTYEGSTLEPHILDQAQGGDIDEAARASGLWFLRRANFVRLAARLRELFSDRKVRPSLLDVGCAHGWFIEANREMFDVTGIEPDPTVARATLARGLPIRIGFFPDVLQAEETFDVIVFNDVLEHIPNINAVLSACFSHLSVDGRLVVNAPSRTGFLYRLSKVMARFGLGGSFDRLWQLGLPSPHVHYLDASSMRMLAERNGFVMESTLSLPSVAASGLYDRIHCSNDISRIKAFAIASVVTLAMPLLAILPSDVEVWFLHKRS